MTQPTDRRSLWWGLRGEAPDAPSATSGRAPLEPRCDVLVVGAGLTGLCTAVLLARAGRVPLVLEAKRAGSGTTGHSSAKVSLLQGSMLQRLRRHAGAETVAAYVEANRLGQHWLLGVLDARGVSYERRPAITYAVTAAGARAVATERAASLEAGLEVTPVPADALPFAVENGIALADQAQIDPLAGVEALTRELLDAGVRELDAWARETFEVGAPQWSWSAQDYRLTTQVPSIGPIPGTKGGLLVATGCDKWGMANAAAAGHILTGDITGNPPSFVPALRSGLPGVADVVDSAITIAGIGMSWVGARAALAVGGGRVGGGKVAGGNPQTPAHGKGHVEGGPVHPVGVATVDGKTCRVSAVCPHLGGILAWERRRDVVGLPFARFAIRGRWPSCRGSGDQRPDRPRRLPR